MPESESEHSLSVCGICEMGLVCVYMTVVYHTLHGGVPSRVCTLYAVTSAHSVRAQLRQCLNTISATHSKP